MSEFVEDLHARIVTSMTEKLGITPKTARLLAGEIIGGMCDTWAGCEPYIGKTKTSGERNRAIIRDWKNGEAVPFLARRYSLTTRRIWQIVGG